MSLTQLRKSSRQSSQCKTVAPVKDFQVAKEGIELHTTAQSILH